MIKIHNTSLLNTPWLFGTGILPQVSKNDDEKCCFFGDRCLELQNFAHALNG